MLIFLVNVDLHRASAGRSPAPTRGTRARSSGRSRRRRPSTTSPRSRSSTHRDEFWHRKYTEDDEGRLRAAAGGRRGRRRAERRDDRRSRHDIHMPSPSYCPLVVRARPADHRLRRRVQELVARRRSARRSCSVRHVRLGASSRRPSRTTMATHRPRRAHSMPHATARAGAPDDAGPDHGTTTRDTNTGVSNPKLGDLAVPVVGVPVLRRVHRDVLPLPRPRRAVPQGPTPKRRCSTSRSRR